MNGRIGGGWLGAALWVLGSGATSGCVHTDATIRPDAHLGRVIIYRNGVAYFERTTRARGSIDLTVPGSRIDDFLKSLSVVDAKTDEPLAVSYETRRARSGELVYLTIELPPGHRDVRITYVTESPPWKPTYRLHLDRRGGGRLQAWAVVDNTTSEPWRQVAIGVGTTSALSFRYDLHSVRTVQREAIETGEAGAAAPPVGGSPYATAGASERVLGELAASMVSTTQDRTDGVPATHVERAYVTEAVSLAGVSASDERTGSSYSWKHAQANAEARDQQRLEQPPTLREIAASLAGTTDRIRIESYALPGETDDALAQARGDGMRLQLEVLGVEADRIEVVASGTTAKDETHALRLVALEGDRSFTQAKDVEPGEALFLAERPLDLDAGHSALITLFDGDTEVQDVYLYDPLSARGSSRHAFAAVRLTNPTDNTLDPGPLTVYAGGRFLGEGMSEPIPARATAIVPYALDRKVVVTATRAEDEQIQGLVSVERGVVTAQARRLASTTFEIHHRGEGNARLWVRHRVPPGWALVDPPPGIERLGDDVLVPHPLEPGATSVLTLTVAAPVTTRLSLTTRRAIEQLEAFVGASDPTEAVLGVRGVIDSWHALADVESDIAARQERLALQRQRLEELRVQLVTLRKVKTADALGRQLTVAMAKHSEAVDLAVGELARLQDERVAAEVRLRTALAELRFGPLPEGATTAPRR